MKKKIDRCGIILAGGSGTRLAPITQSISKQLLPVYNKPMIYYPLSTLMTAKIRNILIISDPKNINLYKDLLGNGKHIGIKLNYKVQKKPRGLSEAFVLGKKFIGNRKVVLILGDNIFYGDNLKEKLIKAASSNENIIFGYRVKDPQRYGVAKINKKGRLESIIEKPKISPSNIAITGMYFYNNDVVKKVTELKYSKRGELEITDLNNIYIKNNNLNLYTLGSETAWLDTGTFQSLSDASMFVMAIENRTGKLVSSPEKISYLNKWINKKQLLSIAKSYKNDYGEKLNIIDENY
ncbi:glucose-1-phosphate thymidylyltransferase RfbA [Candidatus Pelagibacter communis]|uniref:glucose-1-phosphate thymidylyltransferase RfbA n=1 Tax=Pelagibacter ubique TaxID=198252 RepID=UPI000B1CADA3|nr:glucose-1-phosphate thymidylyltransferase RfbA [Candidatus Pelagibacter ubique]